MDGGWCFGCGRYRPGKRDMHSEEHDACDRQKRTLGYRLGELEEGESCG